MPRMDKLGLSDPYATVRLGTDTRKTKCIPCTLEPLWEERFEFTVPPEGVEEETALQLQVRCGAGKRVLGLTPFFFLPGF